MKKLLLTSVSAAALLIAGPALANDSTSTVTQTSSSNTANVDQTNSTVQSDSLIEQGGAGSNHASVTQRGLASGVTPINSSTVKQTGTSDEATVDQESYPGTNGKNVSTISQAGTGVGSAAYVTQYGHNTSGIGQTGAVNLAQVNQGNSTNPQPSQPVGGDNSTISQDGGDTAYVNQNYAIPATGVGNYGGNTSGVTQGDGNNTAYVDQTGLYGSSVVSQSGGATAYVTQNGNSQVSTVTQTNTGIASVTQNGAENQSLVNQSGANTSATVTQSGTEVDYNLAPPNNNSIVLQSGDGAYANVTQTGELNRSKVDQRADADATISQTGVYNESNVTQLAGATGASANVTQTGVPASGGPGVGQGDNRSNITQSGGAAYASVNQTANNPTDGFPSNDSTITQVGASSAYVTQTGDNNVSGVSQTGDSNLTIVNQTTDNATSSVFQNGTGNQAYVTQNSAAQSDVTQGRDNNGVVTTSDSNYADVTQTTAAAGSYSQVRQNGNGNQATVTQAAAGNDSFVRVDGSSNQAYVTQNGANNAQRIRVVGDAGAGNANGVAEHNVAVLEQTATAHNNWSGIAQQGDDNYANVKQSGVGVVSDTTPRSSDPSTRYNNYYNNEAPEADVWQLSNNNKAYIDQASDASRVTIYQGLQQIPAGYDYAPGSNNYASVTQTASADNSRADVIQGGSDNIAYTTQGGLNSQSYVNQLGSGNQAYVTQSTDNNTSFVNQDGTSNVAVVNQ